MRRRPAGPKRADTLLPYTTLFRCLGSDAVGEHVAVVAIAGDDAVLVRIERRLEAERHRFLADVEMAEAADEAEPVKLPGALLEAADEQHLAIIFQHLGLVGLVPLRLGRTRAVGRGRRCGRSVLLCAGALRRCCLGHSSAPSSSSWEIGRAHV